MAWLLAGDFNTTLRFGERMKDGTLVSGDTEELETLLESCHLMDMRFTGEFYTW